MATKADVLALTANIAARRLATDEQLFVQGDDSHHSVAVLVDGSLRVELDGAVLDEVRTPGMFIGEIGALLSTTRTASVIANEPSLVRLIGDPDTFFTERPDLALELARQLAGRLQRILSYLTDLRSQYADADGHLGMVDAVLSRMSSRPPVDIEPGSDRSPDY
jgi:CRP-like cAMP-binding protein